MTVSVSGDAAVSTGFTRRTVPTVPRVAFGRVEPAAQRLERVARSPLFAYGSLLLIQAKALWGIWRYRDLSAGDTSNYFTNAVAWTDDRLVDPLFSPLYTAFWGSLRWIFTDTYAVTIAHRVVIVLAVAVLALAVLRRLLTPGIAWALAVWWAILPLNYDTLNEVHLFSLFPVLVAALVARRFSGPRMRAAVFGILLGAAVLQRNELLVAALLWLALCAAYEWRQRPARGKAHPALARTISPFAAATAVVVLLAALAIWRSTVDLSPGGWIQRAQQKQDIALCQHYSVGYQQRHGRDTSVGWRHCRSFMRRDFGSGTPSFFEALADNPDAMAAHFRWNATLAPYALQLALFDRSSGSAFHDPDYVPVRTGSVPALAGSVAVLAFIAVGLRLLWADRRRWWRDWIAARAWGWGVLGCGAALGVWVAITTHPRPAYLFPLNFALLAALGMCAMAIVHRWPAAGRLGAATPIVALLLVVLLPSHYRSGYANPMLGPGRGAAAMVSRLEPYREELAGSRTTLLGPYSFEACNYLAPEDPCQGSPIGLLGPPGTKPLAWLMRHGVDRIYADEVLLANPAVRQMIAGLERRGWRRLGPADRDADWLLLARPAKPA
jgi:hypothetical protein